MIVVFVFLVYVAGARVEERAVFGDLVCHQEDDSAYQSFFFDDVYLPGPFLMRSVFAPPNTMALEQIRFLVFVRNIGHQISVQSQSLSFCG